MPGGSGEGCSVADREAAAVTACRTSGSGCVGFGVTCEGGGSTCVEDDCVTCGTGASSGGAACEGCSVADSVIAALPAGELGASWSVADSCGADHAIP